jgi:transcriptional regulator with XRE-family HTH domain
MAKPSPNHAGDELLVALGIAIKKARQAAGISQEALAVDSDLDRSYIGGVERGEHNISLMSLKKISTALEIKPSELFRQSKH